MVIDVCGLGGVGIWTCNLLGGHYQWNGMCGVCICIYRESKYEVVGGCSIMITKKHQVVK